MLKCREQDLTVSGFKDADHFRHVFSPSGKPVLPLRVIVPLTEWKDKFHGAIWMVKMRPDAQNHLLKPSAVDTFQIRSVFIARFIQKIGCVSPDTLNAIQKAAKAVMDID